MPCQERITPTPTTEPAPQYSADDPFGLDDIPDFLQRTPGKAKPVQQPSSGDEGDWL